MTCTRKYSLLLILQYYGSAAGPPPPAAAALVPSPRPRPCSRRRYIWTRIPAAKSLCQFSVLIILLLKSLYRSPVPQCSAAAGHAALSSCRHLERCRPCPWEGPAWRVQPGRGRPLGSRFRAQAEGGTGICRPWKVHEDPSVSVWAVPARYSRKL